MSHYASRSGISPAHVVSLTEIEIWKKEKTHRQDHTTSSLSLLGIELVLLSTRKRKKNTLHQTNTVSGYTAYYIDIN